MCKKTIGTKKVGCVKIVIPRDFNTAARQKCRYCRMQPPKPKVKGGALTGSITQLRADEASQREHAIEAAIRNSSRKLDAAPWEFPKLAKRAIKFTLYLIAAAAIAHVFLSYFISLPTLWQYIGEGPLAHPVAFGITLFLTGALLFSFAWFREQTCLIICPYGRLQSTLLDQDTVIIGYDEGRGEPRPRMEGEGQETALVVERFVRTWPKETCGSIKAMSLEDTYWALLELNGATIAPTPNREAPYLELNSNKASAYGFGGCNRFFGSYQASGRSLTFGDLGATRMACPEGMDQEQRFFAALASTTRYEIHGSKLLLFADDELVARFGASAPTQ